MTSQRFCLRWNNHQSNLLSVFDQLLHAETFTDVTLAVEGQYLKAHKMVLSACSPYFQVLFTNTPDDKHPILILKDITLADMKSLLDFMYRGEVSVDQERLTAFLRVAESLRIKGLTEVNDDKPLNSSSSQTPPPPQLHRIQPYLMQQQRKVQGMMLSNPLLGSALTMPKRKRGRPRKLSGSSNGTGNDFDDYESRDNLVQGSPEMLEVKMGTEGYSDGSEDNNRDLDDDDSNPEIMDTSEQLNNSTTPQPTSAPSKEPSPQKDHDNSASDEINPSNYSNYLRYGLLIPKPEPDTRPKMKIRVNPLTQTPATTNIANALQQLHNDSLNNNAPRTVSTPNSNNIATSTSLANSIVTNYLSTQLTNTTTATPNSSTSAITSAAPTTPHSSRPPQRRRVRRKANSPADDQAEHLTEMSVRGLDLFRYAKIFEGIYQCTECAKENIQKTFKNKYSFQRHAFLYHEGTQRKVFPCPVCSKEFSRPDKMKNHMKTTHECFMPKEIVYPLNFLMGGGGDMPQFQQNKLTQQQQQTQNSQQQKVDNASQNNAKAGTQLKVENMIVTPQIQHMLNQHRNDNMDMVPPLVISNVTSQHPEQQQQQQQQHQTNSDGNNPDNCDQQANIQSKIDDVVSRIQITQQITDNDVMSQFNTQIMNMQKIKIENVLPGSD